MNSVVEPLGLRETLNPKPGGVQGSKLVIWVLIGGLLVFAKVLPSRLELQG